MREKGINGAVRKGNVLAHENGCHGTQEDGVAAEEGKEFGGRSEDFPLRVRIRQ